MASRIIRIARQFTFYFLLFTFYFPAFFVLTFFAAGFAAGAFTFACFSAGFSNDDQRYSGVSKPTSNFFRMKSVMVSTIHR